MRVNWMSNSYPQGEGYGRYSAAMILALDRQGIDAFPVLRDHLTMPDWMRAKAGVDWTHLTIACMPPYYLPDYDFPGRVWLMTMTEGGAMPEGWADWIHGANVERAIVPCEHNRRVFQAELDVPVHVVQGGTDPNEYPVTSFSRNGYPYTFLALGDRGNRKGWAEVWQAFYRYFGEADDIGDVRLVVKSRPDGNKVLERMESATTDPRIDIWIDDVEHPSEIWKRADCVVIPSRSEGWGMPHREAAMMGKPVITTKYSGLDDGHTEMWSLPITDYVFEEINLPNDPAINGDWVKVDIDDLGELMRWCYENREKAANYGQNAAQWLRENQTWDQAARAMTTLLQEYV